MDKYDELGCDFLNEAECEEDADEEGVRLGEIEKDHFDIDS